MPEEYLLILLFLIILIDILLIAKRLRTPPPPLKPVVKTRIECEKCDYKSTREFRVGDYVLKVDGKCPKCNSPTIVTGIYSQIPELPRQAKQIKP